MARRSSTLSNLRFQAHIHNLAEVRSWGILAASAEVSHD